MSPARRVAERGANVSAFRRTGRTVDRPPTVCSDIPRDAPQRLHERASSRWALDAGDMMISEVDAAVDDLDDVSNAEMRLSSWIGGPIPVGTAGDSIAARR